MKKSLIILIALTGFFVSTYFLNFNKVDVKSGELNLLSNSIFSKTKSKVISASCGVGNNSGHYIGDTVCGGTCPGGSNASTTSICVSAGKGGGQVCHNETTCKCPEGTAEQGVSIAWTNGAFTGNPGTCKSCTNGAINPLTCDKCPVGYYLDWQNQCSPNRCGATPTPKDWGRPCTGTPNICGQTSQGTIDCSNKCNINGGLGSNNDTCITLTPNITSVSPNNPVTFTWSFLPTPGLTPKCSFVDRARPDANGNATPVPGLSNLDPTTQSATIRNVQRTSEFCLICNFVRANGTTAATAAQHRWVRVINVGEN